MSSRRKFLKQSAWAFFLPSVVQQTISSYPVKPSLLKPSRLEKGGRVAIVAPGGAIFNDNAVSKFVTLLKSLGYSCVVGESCRSKDGQFAGHAKDRAREVMAFFRDPSVKAIIGMRGGSGCAQIMPYLDYSFIEQHPKIIMGFSDITTLINGIYAQTGLVGFHGPVGYSSWGGFTLEAFKRATNQTTPFNFSKHTATKRYTISAGKTSGVLIGGNLTVFTHLIGTPYMPFYEGAILFLEEIDEEPYSVDRMLTHLKLAGVLEALNGIVIGDFKRCSPEEPEKSHSLRKTFDEMLKPLNIPVFVGGDFGHTTHKWTLPIGCLAEMDADNQSLRMLESAVSVA